ncbi:EamA family transporter [Pseudomonas viridiflava]|uniref:EamA family transporter n=1 Tax=Pseudomonas viridiflava TaxID=33069 RepID=UPI000AC24281|nr:EamA family transporter [Pseudomonas viridiflava]
MSATTTVTAAENRKSILIVVGSVFLLSVSDALIKATSAETSMWQLYVIRSLLAIGIITALLMRRGGTSQRWPLSPFWVGTRSLLLALMWIAFYSALPFISLTTAALAIYTTPLFIALFSAVTPDEHVTPRNPGFRLHPAEKGHRHALNASLVQPLTRSCSCCWDCRQAW